MTKLNTINCEEIMTQPLKPMEFVVVNLITQDADPFNMISGTTGISGCVDGSFVLSESKRGSRAATLYCVGRDIENREV